MTRHAQNHAINQHAPIRYEVQGQLMDYGMPPPPEMWYPQHGYGSGFCDGLCDGTRQIVGVVVKVLPIIKAFK